MKICRRIRTMLMNFNNKIIYRENFGKINKLKNVLISIIHLNDRSNTQNRINEKKNDAADQNDKIRPKTFDFRVIKS